jgi:hypothetical protein
LFDKKWNGMIRRSNPFHSSNNQIRKDCTKGRIAGLGGGGRNEINEAGAITVNAGDNHAVITVVKTTGIFTRPCVAGVRKSSFNFSSLTCFSQQPFVSVQQDCFCMLWAAISILQWYEAAITPTVENRKEKRSSMEIKRCIENVCKCK